MHRGKAIVVLTKCLVALLAKAIRCFDLFVGGLLVDCPLLLVIMRTTMNWLSALRPMLMVKLAPQRCFLTLAHKCLFLLLSLYLFYCVLVLLIIDV